MTDRGLQARVLLAEAAALGVTIEDLVAAAGEVPPLPPATGPTVAGYVEAVAPTFSPGTAATYRSYWRLAVARFGERPVASVGVGDCRAVVADAVDRARRGRPGCDGRSSEEACVTALRALFGRAELDGLIARSPAAGLVKPPRRASRRRPLDDTETRELVDAVRATSRDPDLDLLLVRFHLESGARREGALGLRLGDLDRRRSTAWLREKFSAEREQPPRPLPSRRPRRPRGRAGRHHGRGPRVPHRGGSADQPAALQHALRPGPHRLDLGHPTPQMRPVRPDVTSRTVRSHRSARCFRCVRPHASWASGSR